MRNWLPIGSIALALLAASSGPAFAGNILVTGHDTDDHQASVFMNWGLSYLLNNGVGDSSNPTNTGARIGYIGNSLANLSNYLGAYDNFAFYDLDNANWTNAFTDNNAVLVIGTGQDFVTGAGSAALNAQASAFATYFNAGGNLFVNSEQGLGQSFYGFIPSFGGTLANSLPGCTTENGTGSCMAPTAAGTAAGHTTAHLVNASITHTRFTGVDPVFTVLSTYVNNGGAGTGTAITFGLVGGRIGGGGGGGFEQVPEPAVTLLIGAGLLAAIRRRRL